METEYKSYKLKKKVNPKLNVCCLCIALFFGIMWTSFIWMPGNKEEFQVTAINTQITESNTKRTLTLTRWDYSQADKLMEVQFRIENKNYDGKDDYVWSAAERYKGSVDVDEVYADTEILVVQIREIPSGWSTISLRMAFEGNDPDTEYLFKVYGDHTNVQFVDQIEVRDKNGYYILDINNMISYYQDEIENLINDIDETKEKISQVSRTIESESEKLEYMTEQELETSMSEIASLEAKIDGYYQDISNYQDSIVEYNKRISNLQEKIKLYQ